MWVLTTTGPVPRDAPQERGQEVGERFADPGRRLDRENAATVERLGPERGHLELPGPPLKARDEVPQALEGCPKWCA